MRITQQQNNNQIRAIRTRRINLNTTQKDTLDKVFRSQLQPNFAEGEYRYLLVNGVPAEFRNYIWTQLIPNHHRISPNTYNQLLQQLNQFRFLLKSNVNCLILSPPNCKPNNQMNLPQLYKSEENPETVTEGPAKMLKWMQVIKQDIPRTFPQLRIFHNDEEQRQKLSNILGCFALFRSDVGYIQGLSLIGALFLQELNTEYRAFTALTTLITTSVLYDFYTFNLASNAKMCQKIIDRLAKRESSLSDLFISMKIDLNMIIVEWVMTLFTRIFQLDSILNIWDIIFAHKVTPTIIEEVCVAVIISHKETVLEQTDAAIIGKLLKSTKLAFEQEEGIFEYLRKVEFVSQEE